MCSLRAARVAEHIDVTGVVQGVGFRPFVHRLAHELGLAGRVGNDATRVFIDVSGRPLDVEEFARRLVREAPPLAQIESVERSPRTAIDVEDFSIVESRPAVGERTLVPPDTAVCDDCVAELFDPADRRYRHPFITCTNCGPRFTIVEDLPYDREATTMAEFAMCRRCEAEYRDPLDRRYHAQPIACHDCGPTVRLQGHDVTADGAIAAAVAQLGSGSIVAIKGLGGYHLACGATDDAAIARLRERKRRPDKPFAVMVAGLDQAEPLAHISPAEAELLLSPARPIVLLRARLGSALSPLVAPGSPLIAVMLPYTPIHHLLLAESDPLVMTSANHQGEPIIHRDADGDRLLGLADAVLTHDRPIATPCDDSVVRVVDDRLLPIRRARGYAPLPMAWDRARRSVLAVGGELKNAFCIAAADHAWISPHIGDMENLPTLAAFDAMVEKFCRLYDVTPVAIAVDAHPDYLSSNWARTRRPGLVIDVQHHHAHIAAVMAEHRLDPHEPVIGFAFDGTGYGDDGTVWGGEVLLADADGYRRVAHLEPVPLPGGDGAIENPHRMALAHLFAAGIEWDDRLAPVAHLDPVEARVLRRQLEGDVGCVPTSSMGRLFDAVASLLGLRHRISYEAQAAIDLENAALAAGEPRRYEFGVTDGLVRSQPVLSGIVADLIGGESVHDIALGFHHAVADLVTTLATALGGEHGLTTVALSGGVFQNALIVERCHRRLSAAGFRTLSHTLVPPNDGGLALGQAYIAANRAVI